MTICKSFLVTESERKHARRRARFQQSCFFLFFLQGKAPKEIHAILMETYSYYLTPEIRAEICIILCEGAVIFVGLSTRLGYTDRLFWSVLIPTVRMKVMAGIRTCMRAKFIFPSEIKMFISSLPLAIRFKCKSFIKYSYTAENLSTLCRLRS